MPTIYIESSTLERLKSHARPFVDTDEDSVINRALDALGTPQTRLTPIGDDQTGERIVDPQSLPSLTHTKVLVATIDDKVLPKANWGRVRNAMLQRAMKHFDTLGELWQVCPINMVQGKKEDEGYRYISDMNISVQGQDANGACRAIIALAENIGIALDIKFLWRFKDGAAHPGKKGRLTIRG